MKHVDGILQQRLDSYLARPEYGPETVVIGGGTGLSTLLRGLKRYTHNLTAIVTVADNGGSSGMLREDLRMLPPGDIRNCILALAETEPLMNELIRYRFADGRLKGQNFGNLFIAALTSVTGNFYEAVCAFSQVLAITGRVLPVSLRDIQISARLADGTVIEGESAIGDRVPDRNNEIREIRMVPDDAEPMQEAVQAIDGAHVIVLGPGSLYTSVIPNLLFPAVRNAILRSGAPRIYVCNVMTQPAETCGYDAWRHVEALLLHMGLASPAGFLDCCIVNSNGPDLSAPLLSRYAAEQSEPVGMAVEKLEQAGLEVVSAPLAVEDGDKIRHDSDLLARVVMAAAAECGRARTEGTIPDGVLA